MMHIYVSGGKALLLLLDATFDPTGRLTGGFVDNGGWTLEVSGDRHRALGRGDRIMNEWVCQEFETFDVTGARGDYNKILKTVQAQLDAGKPVDLTS